MAILGASIKYGLKSMILKDLRFFDILYQYPKGIYTFNGSRFLVPTFQRGNAYHMGFPHWDTGTRQEVISKKCKTNVTIQSKSLAKRISAADARR